MTKEELLEEFRKYNFPVTQQDISNILLENLSHRAHLLALKKYTVRQFLQLNGADALIESDEEKKIMLDQEYKVIEQYYGEILRELFAGFVARYGSPRSSSGVDEDGLFHHL